VPLPDAAELLRPAGPTGHAGPTGPAGTGDGATNGVGGRRTNGHAAPTPPRTGSGRQKHDSKITVYVSGEELVALEQARLMLRAQHGLPVDRGRIVREAVALLLADLDENGAHSVLVRRLTGSR
jgi:hypothetical protein